MTGAMRSISLPTAQMRVAHAMTQFSGSLRGPKQKGGSRLSIAWHALFRRVGARQTASTLWLGASGAVLMRGFSGASEAELHNATAASADGPNVCILGGGFGGLYTAVKLEGLLWPRGKKPKVTLIDQADRFTFKPLLYELITGAATTDEVAPSYAQLLAPYPVKFVQGRVAAVHPEEATADGGSQGGGTVILTSGQSLPYDWLVLALGAETATFGIPGVKEYAVAFSTYEDAVRVNARLEALASSAAMPEVVIVGGGYAGVELAAAVSDRLRGRGLIQLVTATEDILQGSPEGQRRAASAALKDDGVAVLSSAYVTEVRLAGAGAATDPESAKRLVYLKDSQGQTEILEADIVIWAAGQAPTPKIESSSLSLPFPTDATGATQTDPTLRVLKNRRVFALGDVAVMGAGTQAGSKRLPATAQVAFQQADYVAWNIWASVNDRPMLRFSYQHLGDMMSLGSTRGAVSLPIPIPPPVSAAAQAGPFGEVLRAAGVKINTTYAGASDGITLEGPLAAMLRRAAYLYRQPTDQQRLRVAASWATQASANVAELARQVLSGGPIPDKRNMD